MPARSQEGHGMEDRVSPRRLPLDLRILLRFRAVTLFLFLAATVFLCVQIKNLRLDPDPLGSLYPAGHPFIPALDAIEAMAPIPPLLIGIIARREGGIYNPETLAKVDAVTKEIMGIEGVLPGEINSITRGIDHYNHTAAGLSIEPVLGDSWPESAADFEALRRKLAVNPKGPGRYVAYDGTATMITAPLTDIDRQAEAAYARLPVRQREQLPLPEFRDRARDDFLAALSKGVREIRRRHVDAKHDLFFMGPQLLEAEMTRMGLRQLPVAAGSMLVILAVLLALRFRSLPGVLLPVLSLAVPLLWCLGFVGPWAGCSTPWDSSSP